MLDRHEMDSVIVATTARVLCIPEREIEPDVPLFDLGADSLDVLDLFFRLGKRFDIDIAVPVQGSLTINEIAGFVQDHARCSESPEHLAAMK